MSATCPTCRAPLPPIPGAPENKLNHIADELRAGRKIHAIKVVRACSSWGLKEAKDYVDCPHRVSPGGRATPQCPRCRRPLPPIPDADEATLQRIAESLIDPESAARLVQKASGWKPSDARAYVKCPHLVPE